MERATTCREVPAIPYLAWHADAQTRHRKGERQQQCKACGLWFWEHEIKVHRSTQQEASDGTTRRENR